MLNQPASEDTATTKQGKTNPESDEERIEVLKRSDPNLFVAMQSYINTVFRTERCADMFREILQGFQRSDPSTENNWVTAVGGGTDIAGRCRRVTVSRAYSITAAIQACLEVPCSNAGTIQSTDINGDTICYPAGSRQDFGYCADPGSFGHIMNTANVTIPLSRWAQLPEDEQTTEMWNFLEPILCINEDNLRREILSCQKIDWLYYAPQGS